MFEYKNHLYRDKIESKNLNNYEKIERIGKGGFGKVYLCKDKRNSDNVVIKKVRKDKYAYVETMILKILNKNKDKLKYPTIINFIDAFKYNDNVYIVMKRIDGITYNEYIKKRYHNNIHHNDIIFSNHDIYLIMNILKKINTLIKDIHNLGILHLDIKGSNIMLNIPKELFNIDKYYGDSRDINIYLIDYGLSRLNYKDKSDDIYSVKSIHGVLGTSCYISPEILNHSYNRIDTCSDIYSFGMILYFTFFRKKFDDIVSLNKEQLKENILYNLKHNDLIENNYENNPTNNKDLNYLIIQLISGMLIENTHKRFKYDDIKKNIKNIIQFIDSLEIYV